MSSDFSQLLQEAEKLTANFEGVSELPKIDRSLRQVLEDSNDLFSRVTRTGSQDVQANLLLGSQGIDLPKIVQKLENISAKRSVEPIKPIVDTDVPSFLHNELQNIIVGVVDDEFRRCVELSEKNAWEHQKAEWIQERAKIINAMTAPSRDIVLVSKKSVFLDTPPAVSNQLGLQEAVYASKVIEYNKSLNTGINRINLVNTFSKSSDEFKDTKVNDMWEMLKYMTDLPPIPTDKSVVEVRNSSIMVHTLINQARRYLEERYKTYMSNIINENFAEARRGGLPGTYSLALSFVGIRFPGKYTGFKDDTVEGKPVWPVVYYCLRSGDIAAAIHCLKNAPSVDARDIISLLEAKLKKCDPEEINEKEMNLQMLYRRVTKDSNDPFHRIVYDILCHFDKPEEHSEVAKTADDYLWLKLGFLKIYPESESIQTYKNLQLLILEEYGESHYDAVNHPHLYFQMLILTGQFEAAIEFLARNHRYQIHSVHMAIALNELHLLCLPLHANSPLICTDPADPKPTRLLNICRLIMIYVQKFDIIATREAAHYYYMLRNIMDPEGRSIFINCIVDLATETHEYYLLFGKYQLNGARVSGILDEFLTAITNVESIAQITGENLVKKGLFEDAIELFDLANNQEEVLRLLSILLSQVVHLQTTEGSLREKLPVKINELNHRYSSLGYNCSTNCVTSFLVLKDLLGFFDQYHAKQYEAALQILEEIKLVPLQLNQVEERLTAFKRFGSEICKVMPDVVMATMNILFEKFQKAKSSSYLPSNSQEYSQNTQLIYLREQAKALTSFTALLPYRMPGDTNSRLVQMEILMH